MLRPRLPEGLGLDHHEGRTYLSLVGLEITGPSPGRIPPVGVAPLLRYRQLNIRLYVTGELGPGIFLLETRVDRSLPAAFARLAGMRYHLDRSLVVAIAGGGASLRARGIEAHGWVAPEPPQPLDPESRDHFLLERSLVYSRLPGGRLYGVRVSHRPWSVRPVIVSGSLPSEIVGFPGEVGPVCAHLTEPVDVSVVEVTAARRVVATEPMVPEIA